MKSQPNPATCTDCGSALDIELCTVCKEPICPNHRTGTGRLKDGYQCKVRDCWYVGYPGRQRLEALQAMMTGASRTDAKESERAACEFFEALLKLEYPGRRVAVTPAPFSDDLPEDVRVQLDGSGVLDVTVGPRDGDPAWVCFRCPVQFEVTRRDWLAAAHVLQEKVKHAFEDFQASTQTL